jgi:hypothetical protein
MASRITSSIAFNFYKRSIKDVVPFSAAIGFVSGITDIINNQEKTPALFKFSSVIGYTTLGVVVGVTYPISFPIIMWDTIKNDRI